MEAQRIEQPAPEQTLVEVIFSHPGSIGMRFAERLWPDGARWLVVEAIAEGSQAAMVPQLHIGMVVHSVGDQLIERITAQTAIEMMRARPVRLRFWPVPEAAAGHAAHLAAQAQTVWEGGSTIGAPTTHPAAVPAGLPSVAEEQMQPPPLLHPTTSGYSAAGGGAGSVHYQPYAGGEHPQQHGSQLAAVISGMQAEMQSLREQLQQVSEKLGAEQKTSQTLRDELEKLREESTQLHALNDELTAESVQLLGMQQQQAPAPAVAPHYTPAPAPSGSYQHGGGGSSSATTLSRAQDVLAASRRTESSSIAPPAPAATASSKAHGAVGWAELSHIQKLLKRAEAARSH
jgi:hypothetical protein